MQQLMNQLKKISIGIASVIGMVLGGFYYFLLYNDSSLVDGKIQSAQAELSLKSAKLKKIKKEAENRSGYEEELSKMAIYYKKALSYIPNEFSISELMRVISNEARASGSNIVKIIPSEKTNNIEFYQEFMVDLELEGRFGDLTLFLSNISKVPRILNISKLQMKLKQMNMQAPILTFNGTIIGYRYIEQKSGSEK